MAYKQIRLSILVMALVMLAAFTLASCSLGPNAQRSIDSVPIRRAAPVLGIHHLKGSNAAGTHGTLVLHHGCVMLDLGNGFVEMLAWPSDFTVEGTKHGFQIGDGQGRVVAEVGDRIRLGGGPIGPEAIYTTDNHALPSRCLTDHIFAVDRQTV
jgi:hypothetical protein